MKTMVTGATGQLGSEIIKVIALRGIETIGTVHSNNDSETDGTVSLSGIQLEEMDITDHDAVFAKINKIRPDAIIHCAAWTDVEAAEMPENRETVYAVNAKGTRNIAEAARSIGAKLMYISTDYVFGKEGNTPRKPDDMHFAPLNHYGKSKLEGEMAVIGSTDKTFIVRTSWLFGHNGSNFVATMIDAGKKHHSVRVVNDQIGTPTYAPDLAVLLADMITTDKYGCYHVTNSEEKQGEYISWYDLTREIYRQTGCNADVVPVSSEEYSAYVAERPRNSRLDKSKLAEAGFTPLPDWKDAVKRYVRERERQND